MKLSLKEIPVPLFIISDRNEILACTAVATQVFPSAGSFFQLIDEESVLKVREAFSRGEETTLEANMLTHTNPVSLFELHYVPNHARSWSIIVCHPMDQHVLELQHRLQLLRTQLTDSSTMKSMSMSTASQQEHWSRLEQLSLQEEIREVRSKMTMALDLLGILQPDILEAGKGQYFELILESLQDAHRFVAHTLLNAVREKD